METKNSVKSRCRPALALALALQFACLPPPQLAAQEASLPEGEPGALKAPEPEPDAERPERTDATSAKLIENYLAAGGGADAHRAVHNLRATGVINEAGKTKTFELVETRDGKRYLATKWRHLGQDYHEVEAFDGLVAWKRRLSPRKGPPENHGGPDGEHFIHQRWLLHPFVPPWSAKYVFRYQSVARVQGRQAYLVVGYGPNNVRSWFYFDKETFLVTRHGGLGSIAGVREYLDFRASRFAYAGGILLPKKLELLAENDAFGTVTFEQIETNVALDSERFAMPPNPMPILRSRRSGEL